MLIKPESWIDCFALALDADGEDVWEIEDLEDVDRLSLMGALDLAAHRRKYPKAVMDAVVVVSVSVGMATHSARRIHSLMSCMMILKEGGNFIYEEFRLFQRSGRAGHMPK